MHRFIACHSWDETTYVKFCVSLRYLISHIVEFQRSAEQLCCLGCLLGPWLCDLSVLFMDVSFGDMCYRHVGVCMHCMQETGDSCRAHMGFKMHVCYRILIIFEDLETAMIQTIAWDEEMSAQRKSFPTHSYNSWNRYREALLIAEGSLVGMEY